MLVYLVVQSITLRKRTFKVFRELLKRVAWAVANFIPAKSPAARIEIFCAQSSSSRHAAQDRAFRKMKMLFGQKDARRSASSVREESARSKDKRRLGGKIRDASPTPEQISETVREIVSTNLRRLHR